MAMDSNMWGISSPNVSDGKIKESKFIGPQIKELM